MHNDYFKNYMRKRFGGSFWPVLIVILLLLLISLVDWFFNLNLFG